MTNAVDQFSATVRKLSTLRVKTIKRLTEGQPQVERAAVQLRRIVRGSKLPRRLRRKVQLGLNGSF